VASGGGVGAGVDIVADESGGGVGAGVDIVADEAGVDVTGVTVEARNDGEGACDGDAVTNGGATVDARPGCVGCDASISWLAPPLGEGDELSLNLDVYRTTNAQVAAVMKVNSNNPPMVSMQALRPQQERVPQKASLSDGSIGIPFFIPSLFRLASTIDKAKACAKSISPFAS